MGKFESALMCVSALAAAAAVCSAEPFRTSATPGLRHYRYTSLEQTQGQAGTRYRVDFDLATGSDGSVIAILRKAEREAGGVWSAPAVDAQCRKVLHAKKGELARITLWPLDAEAAKLGDTFMAMCAPAAYFFPITDLLNVSLVQTQPSFGLAKLTAPGAKARFEGFATSLDRLGVAITASSPGGEIELHALDANAAVVDWKPDPMQIKIVNHATAGSPEVTLNGFEKFAFRLEIDPTSGVLKRAATISDNLDLTVDVPGVPAEKAPRVAIMREVAIETRE